MNTVEALDYVDIVIERLHEWGVISEQKYGSITEAQRGELADLIVAKSEE